MTEVKEDAPESSIYKRLAVEEIGGQAAGAMGSTSPRDAADQVLRAVAQNIGVPFPRLKKGKYLPMSCMLEVTKWLTIPDIVALRETESTIELKRVSIPTIQLNNRHVRAWDSQVVDWLRHVEMWRTNVLHLRLEEDFPPLFPQLARAFALPSFAGLRMLVCRPPVHNAADKRIVLDPKTWRQILLNCPKLEIIFLRVQVLGLSPMTEAAWLSPLAKHKVAWKKFQIDGAIAPPNVYLAVANSDMTSLTFETPVNVNVQLPAWTTQQVEELLQRTGPKLQYLRFGRNIRPQDLDVIAKILMDNCPNLATVPWPAYVSLSFSSTSIQRMYVVWNLRNMPPPFTAVVTNEKKIEIPKTRVPLWEYEVTAKTLGFFREWTMTDHEKMLMSSTQWQKIVLKDLATIDPGTGAIWRPSFDPRILQHVLQHGANLHTLVIDLACPLEQLHLQAMLTCPHLRKIVLTQPNDMPIRFTANKNMLFDTMMVLFMKMVQSRRTTEWTEFVLASCLIAHFTVIDWLRIIALWHESLQRPRGIVFRVLVPKEFEETITSSSRQRQTTDVRGSLIAFGGGYLLELMRTSV